MTFSTIMATVDGSPGSKTALAAAVGLAQRFGARLEVLALAAPTTPLLAASVIATEAYALEIDAARDAAKEALHGAVAAVEAAGVPYEAVMIASPLASIQEAVATRALLADLVVTAQKGLTSDLTGRVIDGALFNSPAPILLWPADVDPTAAATLGGKATLAWDARPQAARAARLALPLLDNGGPVAVVTVDHRFGDEPFDDAPGEPVVAWLERKGVKAEWRDLEGSPVADLLLRDAAERGSDLIVMGGYGHSQLREAIFGGVTETLLSGSSTPLFMAH